MLSMILKMSGATLLYILLTLAMWYWCRDKKLTKLHKVLIGIIFGGSAIISTHFGIPYEGMIINVRDMGPLVAGLFFSPASGVIAGLIGGIERYIAGTYFGVGEFTRIACSVSTCLAGFVAYGMNTRVFKGKKPSPQYAFFMGAVMEVFHMYVVFITHRNDLKMAFLVVSTCAVPMIIFTGLGMSIDAILLQVLTGEWKNPFVKRNAESIPISQTFQRWLFLVTFAVIISVFGFSFFIQTESAYQNSCLTLERSAEHIKERFLENDTDVAPESDVDYDIILKDGYVAHGTHRGVTLSPVTIERLISLVGTTQEITHVGEKSLVRVEEIDDTRILAVGLSDDDVYWYRNAQAYETALADILLFTVIYVLIAFLVNQIVVNNIQLINSSLSKITNGDLNEVVDVRNSSEFASLSDDINETVIALKGYIEAAEKRIEQELMLAATIQESSLPKSFDFPGRGEFDLYATMKPAKEVGGDFYDFFFISMNKMAFVIADVSGKGIPAAMFMMRSKTEIRSLAEAGGTPAEIIYKANETLCEGNEAEMFVTVWLGIIDLSTGVMTCANAGHEYPAIQRAGGDFELLKDKHSLAVAAMNNLKAREYEIKLAPGDTIFVYSDGIPEAINEEVEQYGTDRMLEALNENKDKPVTELLPAVTESVNRFKGKAEQFDDMTMLAFKFKGYLGAWNYSK